MTRRPFAAAGLRRDLLLRGRHHLSDRRGAHEPAADAGAARVLSDGYGHGGALYRVCGPWISIPCDAPLDGAAGRAAGLVHTPQHTSAPGRGTTRALTTWSWWTAT